FGGGVGRLHAVRCFLLVIGRVGDQRGMVIPEYGEVVAAEPVDKGERPARIVRTGIGPSRQKRGGDIALLAIAGRSKLGARSRKPLCLYCFYADDEARQAIFGILLQKPVSERKGIL